MDGRMVHPVQRGVSDMKMSEFRKLPVNEMLESLYCTDLWSEICAEVHIYDTIRDCWQINEIIDNGLLNNYHTSWQATLEGLKECTSMIEDHAFIYQLDDYGFDEFSVLNAETLLEIVNEFKGEPEYENFFEAELNYDGFEDLL